jgi:asparagine synthase (glutamine-hydrolysing)
VPKEVLDKFSNREQFSIYTRGLLGAQSSYMLRQNYVETASPFLDVDFLNFILSVPFNYRVKHKIYLAWIASKYPIATRYGWEKWHGAKPTERGRLIEKKVYQLRYDFATKLSQVLPLHIGMTPVDYWLNSNSEIANDINRYYGQAIVFCADVLSNEVYADMVWLYQTGNVGEMEQVLTACAAIKMMFE